MKKLSNQKLKYIRRHAESDSPKEIAEALRIPVHQVEAALRELAEKGDVAPAVVGPARGGSVADEVIAYLLIVVAVAAPLIIFPTIAEATKTPQAAFIQFSAWALLIGVLVTRQRRQRLQLGPWPLIVSALLLIVWAGLSFAWAESYRDGIERMLIWVSIPVVYLVTLNVMRRQLHIDVAICAIFCCGFLAAAIGLMQFWFGLDVFLQTSAPAATFVNKNMAMHFMVLTIPLGVYLAHRFRELNWWVLIGVALMVMVVYAFHGKSKGAWAALVVEGVVFAVYWLYAMARKRTRPLVDPARWAVVVMCLIGALVLMHTVRTDDGLGFSNELGTALASVLGTLETADVYEDPTLQPAQPSSGNEASTMASGTTAAESPGAASLGVRLVVWKNTVQMWKAHPVVGVGMGNFRAHYDLFAQSAVRDPFWPKLEWHRAHNDFLQTLAELGIVGALLLAALLLSLALLVAQVLLGRYDPLSLSLTMALAGIAIPAFVSFPFDRTIPPLLAAIYAGLLMVQYRKLREPAADDAEAPAVIGPVIRQLSLPAGAGWHFGLAGLAAIALIVNSRIQWRIVEGDTYARQMYDANAAGDHAGVVLAARNIRRVDPMRYRPLCYEGRALMALHRIPEAVDVLERLRVAYPVWYVGLHNLAVAYQRNRDSEIAIETARRALELFPQAAESYNAIGCAYLDLQAFEDSEASFRKSIEINRENHEYWYNLGLALYHQGNPRDALEMIGKAIELNDRYALAHKDAGAMHRQLAAQAREAQDAEALKLHTVQAAEHMAAAIRIDPHVEQAEQMLGFLQRIGYPVEDLLPKQRRTQPPTPQRMPMPGLPPDVRR